VRSITTGAGQTEYTPIGHTTNLASRMQTLAPIGSIAATEVTRKLCEGYFILKPLGATKVKGVSEPVNVYEVTGLGPLRTRLQRAAGRGLTKFVGRQREMDVLRHALEQAKAGHGQIVAAMGAPGVGKSRLFFEFKATSQSGSMVLEAFSVSHGKASAYLPVIDLLHSYFRMTSDDDERVRREKVGGKVLMLDRALEDTLPYLFGLLGIVEGDDPLAQMDGQIRKRRTLEAIRRILLRESLNQPLIVIFEDLHWIDEQTQALLNLLVDSIANARILLLVNYRPEYRHEWGNRTFYTQLGLEPLAETSAAEMLTGLLGESTELAPLKQLLAARTQGNPFFIEEIVQVLFEQGVLARNGAVRLVRPLTEIKVPPTVQAILAARIDRLPPDEKELLQTLAVLGKEFTLNQLKEVTAKSESELQRTLSDLQMADFIYEQPATGDIEYTFKHALTQEVAYSSILIERRKALHEQAGAALEEVFAANLSDHYDELARHYRRSGNAPKAITYLRLAAEQAMSRSAYGEAAEPLNTALELLATLPATTERDRSESVLRLTLVSSTIFNDLGALIIAATSESLERARELCAKAGKDSHRCEVLSALAFLYANRSESKKAHAVCDELLEIATEMHDTDMIGRARFWEAFSSFWQGNFVAALEDFDRAYELPMSARSKRELSYGGWQTVTRSLGALTLFIVGYPEKASLRNREALALARESTDRSSLVPILIWSFFLNFLMRDPQAAYPQVEEARQLQREHGFAALSSVIEFWRGCTLVQLGQIEEGLAEMSPHLAALMQFVRTPVGSLIFPLLAAVYLTARRRDEGLETVARGLETLQNNGNHNGEAELRRLRGELLLLGGDSEQESARCFREAIEVARRQGAKAWELRATMSLARLLKGQGRRHEARTILAEIYNWFTEGFDAADLTDAKALLDELST